MERKKKKSSLPQVPRVQRVTPKPYFINPVDNLTGIPNLQCMDCGSVAGFIQTPSLNSDFICMACGSDMVMTRDEINGDR